MQGVGRGSNRNGKRSTSICLGKPGKIFFRKRRHFNSKVRTQHMQKHRVLDVTEWGVVKNRAQRPEPPASDSSISVKGDNNSTYLTGCSDWNTLTHGEHLEECLASSWLFQVRSPSQAAGRRLGPTQGGGVGAVLTSQPMKHSPPPRLWAQWRSRWRSRRGLKHELGRMALKQDWRKQPGPKAQRHFFLLPLLILTIKAAVPAGWKRPGH